MSAMARWGSESTPESASAAKPWKGAFIVFEGIDGSGKSTVARMVYESLVEEMPGQVVLTAEPTGSFIGEAVRRANSGEAGELAEALLFVADRAEHTLQIRSWLEEGKVVLCDRYYASTIAYQGALLKECFEGVAGAVEWLKALNQPVVIRPDLTLVLTVKVKLAMERLRSRRGLTKFEDLDFLSDVDGIYRDLCREDRSFLTLDASRPAEDVAREALRLVRSKI